MKDFFKLAQLIVQAASHKGIVISIAESCTGGLLCSTITAVPGSSAVFDCGFLTYSNTSKQRLLEVDGVLLSKHGAVSEEVAKSMAYGAVMHSSATLGISVTGIAGSIIKDIDSTIVAHNKTSSSTHISSSSEYIKKPVGLVYIGTYFRGIIKAEQYLYHGSRNTIRLQAVECCLKKIYDLIVS